MIISMGYYNYSGGDAPVEIAKGIPGDELRPENTDSAVGRFPLTGKFATGASPKAPWIPSASAWSGESIFWAWSCRLPEILGA